MPVYNVVGPDGKKFRVNSKEGRTQEDANRYIFSKYYADKPTDVTKISSLASSVPTIDEGPKPQERSYVPAPSLAEKALQPVTTYPEAVQRAAGKSYEFAQEGVAQLQESGVLPKVKGAGKIGLGMLGVATAPVEAAIETVAGKPIEEATGIPSEGTELVLGMALPFGSKTKAARKAAKTVEEKTGVDVLEATAAGQAEKTAREQVIKSTQVPIEQIKPGIASKPIQIYQDYVGRPALEFMKQSPLATTTGAVTGVFGMENLPEDATVQDKAQAFALSALAGFGGAKALKYVGEKIPAGNDENIADKFARGLIDNYGLPQDYLDVKQNAKMFKNEMSSDFLDLTRDVAKLSDDERKAMYYIMQGEGIPLESVAALSEKARDTITKYGQKMVDVGLLSPETFEKNAATYLRREYTSKLKPEGLISRAANNLRLIGSSLKPRGVIIEISPKNLEQYKAEGWEEFGAAKSGNKIRVRRQLTPEERRAKGEIDDAAYAISRTGQLMSNDIATYKMYDDVSKMKQYVSDQPVEGWIQISTDKIPKTNVARYGNLAGKYVSPEVARDLQGLEFVRGLDRNPLVKTYRQALSAWKTGKTALNPAVHMNNVVSNVMLYDLSGSDWRSLASAANELRKGEGSDLYKQAEKLGVFDAGFSAQELGREGKSVLDAIETSRPADNAVDAAIKIASAGWKKTGGKIIDAYQGEDSIFRFGIFLDRLRAGMSPEDAAKESKKWLIDYEINAPMIQAMRNTTHPFIAYSYRAIPLLAESAVLRPWKYAKWAALGYGLNEYGEQESPGRDIEKERRMMSEYQKGTMFGVPGAPPTMIKLPSEEPTPDAETGEVPPSMYLDVQRFIPGGDVFATTEAAGRRIEYLPQFLQPGGPLFDAFSTLYEGRDPFTGRDLPGMNIGATEGEVRANNAAIKFSKFVSTLLPNLPGIPGAPATEKFKKAEAGAESLTQPKITTTQAVLQTFGIKVTPIDPDKLSMQQLFNMDRDVDNVAKEYRSVLRKHGQGLVSDEELTEASTLLETRLQGIFEKYRKREEGPAKEEPDAEEPAAQEEPKPEAGVIPFTGPDGKVYNVKVKPGQTEADVEKYIMGKYYSQKKAQGGLVEPGNIDVSKLPAVRNADGTYSTVRSMGVNINGKEVLIPTVVNGRVVSDKEAIDHYLKTGKHLGVFSTPEESSAYAEKLHQMEAQRIKKARGGYTLAEELLLRRYANR
jgi:hypothetical protein